MNDAVPSPHAPSREKLQALPRIVIFPFMGSEIGGSHVSALTLGQTLQDEYDTRCFVLCPDGTRIAEQARRQGLSVVDCGEPPVSRHHPAYDALRFRSRWKLVRSFPE